MPLTIQENKTAGTELILFFDNLNEKKPWKLFCHKGMLGTVDKPQALAEFNCHITCMDP